MHQYGAAFAGGDLLVRVEAEYSERAEAAHRLPVEPRAHGLACILDQREVVAAGDRSQRIHLRRHAERVNGDQGACARSDGALNGGGVEVERKGIDLHEDRYGAYLRHGIGHSDEGE